MRNQDRKAIFITGSSSGLGRATAKLFAMDSMSIPRCQRIEISSLRYIILAPWGKQTVATKGVSHG
jgi:NADP-dependent 3-hydroxy acid dehydrogenase YdfG